MHVTNKVRYLVINSCYEWFGCTTGSWHSMAVVQYPFISLLSHAVNLVYFFGEETEGMCTNMESSYKLLYGTTKGTDDMNGFYRVSNELKYWK